MSIYFKQIIYQTENLPPRLNQIINWISVELMCVTYYFEGGFLGEEG